MAKENPFNISPPNINIAISTINVVNEVLRVRLKVLFKAVFTISSFSQDL